MVISLSEMVTVVFFSVGRDWCFLMRESIPFWRMILIFFHWVLWWLCCFVALFRGQSAPKDFPKFVTWSTKTFQCQICTDVLLSLFSAGLLGFWLAMNELFVFSDFAWIGRVRNCVPTLLFPCQGVATFLKLLHVICMSSEFLCLA